MIVKESLSASKSVKYLTKIQNIFFKKYSKIFKY